LGASFDTPEDNKVFAEAQGFGYRLLSDVDKTVGGLYQVTPPPDHKYADFPLRIAYLIDHEGTVRKAYQVSDVRGFAADVLDDLHTFQQG